MFHRFSIFAQFNPAWFLFFGWSCGFFQNAYFHWKQAISMCLYIWYGKPREGKNMVVAERMISWLDNQHRKVYSNFPFLSPRGNSPFIWDDKLIYENVQDAIIVIDESYQDWGSSDTDKLREADRMTFIHTTGHQNNDVHFIVQSPVRILKAIRDVCTEVHIVKKFCVPWPLPWWKDKEGENRPVLFRVLTYSDWKDQMDPAPERADAVRYFWFKMKTANCYDTHYFRNNRPAHVGETWKQKLDREAEEVRQVTELLSF